MAKLNVYEIITGRIIEQLELALNGEEGCIPWRRPWNAKTEWPRNLVSGKPYQGINVFLLSSQRFESPYWLTFKQATDKGGSVRKGEKSTPVIFWNFSEKQDADTGEVKKIPFLRYYSVFNTAQIDGLVDLPAAETAENIADGPLAKAAEIVASMPNPPELKHGFTRACYFPGSDQVQMPTQDSFYSTPEYYSTLFHELTHSTMHETRLDRKVKPVDMEERSKEELCAELGASFLCGIAGIENTLDNSTAYIQGWLSELRNDPKMVILAAAQAQKAANYILGEAKQAEEVMAFEQAA